MEDVLFMQNALSFDQEFPGMKTKDTPNVWVVILYSVATPVLALCGILGNTMMILVLNKKQFSKCSFYVYLRVLGTCDMIFCIFLCLSGFAQGTFWYCSGWAMFHMFISNPIKIFLLNVSTIATVYITLDRWIFVSNPVHHAKPKFCSKQVARMVTIAAIIFSTFYTLPYCFCFTLDNGIKPTPFARSVFFRVFTWLDFFISSIVPAIVLTTGNVLLLNSLRKSAKIQHRYKLATGKIEKMRDQRKMTLTLIAMVFFYCVNVLPFHLSKSNIICYVFFKGDYERMSKCQTLHLIYPIVLTLIALYMSFKFILYAFFCPPFSRAMKKAVCGSNMQPEHSTVDVFLIDEKLQRIRRSNKAWMVKLGDGLTYLFDSKINERQ